jgi:hypothetical protein
MDYDEDKVDDMVLRCFGSPLPVKNSLARLSDALGKVTIGRR